MRSEPGQTLLHAILGSPQGLFSRLDSRYSRAMAEKYVCSVCDLEESRCKCERYCYLCQGANDVRLCQDGVYYCLECREACDLQAQI